MIKSNLMIDSNFLVLSWLYIHPGPAVRWEELALMMNEGINFLVKVENKLQDSQLKNTIRQPKSEAPPIVVLVCVSKQCLIADIIKWSGWKEDGGISMEWSLQVEL